ncbi:MAG: hypothetical protein JSU65_01855 [Candidatus Zixiibacteriota bacterium]|nr:MAG: hypothetical protein JSU65_01855 [candidate division Zixibacteria bacterium]
MSVRAIQRGGLILILALSVQAEATDDFVIGEMDIPSFEWGQQTAFFEVTNLSDWMKYVTVETEMTFEGSYINPRRLAHQYYPLEPGETKIVKPVIEIPGNYGQAHLYVRLYDVIDTLDEILPGQKVFERAFSVKFKIPPAVVSYFEQKIVFPPMVTNNLVWDNEFSHVLPVMLSEGRSLGEIARQTESDTSYVQQVAEKMRLKGFLYRHKDSSYSPMFPVFRVQQAEEVKQLVDETSRAMAEHIAGNLPRYDAVLDSLIEAGALTKDTNDFIHGGTVLYRRYPVIGALLLWYNLGKAFITGRDLLEIYRQTNPCHAAIGKYMYAVEGGDVFSGTHYYEQGRTARQMDIRWGDQLPKVTCSEGFMAKSRLTERRDFSYGRDYAPEAFMVSALIVRPALHALSEGTEVVFEDIRERLTAISTEYGHEEVTTAERYWFWNLFATRTLRNLVEDGVLKRRGNGQFKLIVQN